MKIYFLILSLLFFSSYSLSQWDCPTRPERYRLQQVFIPWNLQGQAASNFSVKLNNSGEMAVLALYPNNKVSLFHWSLQTGEVTTIEENKNEDSIILNGISNSGEIFYGKITVKKDEFEPYITMEHIIFSNQTGKRSVEETYTKLEKSGAYPLGLSSDGLLYISTYRYSDGEEISIVLSVTKSGIVNEIPSRINPDDEIEYEIFGVNNRVVGKLYNKHIVNSIPVQYIPSTNQIVRIPGLVPNSFMKEVTDLNDKDYVVGSAVNNTGDSRAVLWKHGSLIQNLGVLVGTHTQSYAEAINSSNEVVGTSISDTSTLAFLWNKCSGLRNLNTLRPTGSTVSIREVEDINDLGQIAVTSSLKRLYLLYP